MEKSRVLNAKAFWPACIVLTILGSFFITSCSSQPPQPKATPKTGLSLSILARPVPSDEKISAQATNVFREMGRLPARFNSTPVNFWTDFVRMERDVNDPNLGLAYFSDWSFSTKVRLSNAVDGDTWDFALAFPDGRVGHSNSVRFYATYSTDRDCFVSTGLSGGWYICGSTSMDLVTALGNPVSLSNNSRCSPLGTYEWILTHNGQVWYRDKFKLLPQLPPNTVPAFSQRAYTTGYGYPAYYNTHPESTMRNYGCAVTSMAMVLNWYGIELSPQDVQNWMAANNGYSNGNLVDFHRFPRLAQQYGIRLSYARVDGARNQAIDAQIERAVCSSGPQILRVAVPAPVYTHFLVTKGFNEAKTTHYMNDPWYGGASLTDPNGGIRNTLGDIHNDTYNSARLYTFQGLTSQSNTPPIALQKNSVKPQVLVPINLSSVRIGLSNSPDLAELLVVDPQSRRTGLQATTSQKFAEIPDANYESEIFGNPETQTPPVGGEFITINEPAVGEYTVQVIGVQSGQYRLYIEGNSSDSQHQTQIELPALNITPGEIHTYRFSYDQSATSNPQPVRIYTGKFLGTGRETTAIDSLLSYNSPTQASTRIAGGLRTYTVQIMYGAAMTPGTFQATLNQTNITSSFRPIPGGLEAVGLNLVKGKNTLQLSLRGSVGGQTVTDTDSLVFNAQ